MTYLQHLPLIYLCCGLSWATGCTIGLLTNDAALRALLEGHAELADILPDWLVALLFASVVVVFFGRQTMLWPWKMWAAAWGGRR